MGSRRHGPLQYMDRPHPKCVPIAASMCYRAQIAWRRRVGRIQQISLILAAFLVDAPCTHRRAQHIHHKLAGRCTPVLAMGVYVFALKRHACSHLYEAPPTTPSTGGGPTNFPGSKGGFCLANEAPLITHWARRSTRCSPGAFRPTIAEESGLAKANHFAEHRPVC